RRLHHAQGGAAVGEEVGDSGGVDEIDLRLLPFGVGQARRERVLAGDFLVVEVGGGGAVVHLSEPVDRAGGEEQGGHELRLAGSAVPDEGDIAKTCGVVHLHRGTPP